MHTTATILVRNKLLQALPPDDLHRLRPLLERVPLKQKRVLHFAKLPIEHVYFIEEGLVSVVAGAEEDNHGVEAWLIGPEGMAGLPVVLGAETSPHKRTVQADGLALRMSADDLRSAIDRIPALRSMLLYYVNAVLVQAGQSAACNAQHSVQQRLARWLLMTHDRLARDDLPLTHDVIAKMLGIRRASVTDKLHELEAAGAVRGENRCIHVLHRMKLEELACGCYHVIRSAT